MENQNEHFETNFNVNNSKEVIIEGDEYFSSFSDKMPKFLHYHPNILVITNIDMDHFDYYRNLTDVMDKFNKLVKTVPPDGVIVACHDDKNIKRLYDVFVGSAPKRMDMPLTLEHLAKLSHVGRSTVSRVIKGDVNVKEETRLRVLEVLNETNFLPN